MPKKEKNRKCDKNCISCQETNCAEDFRISCYGQQCQTCKLNCDLKAAGSSLIKEIREERYAQQGGKMRTDIGLLEEIGIDLNIRSSAASEIQQARLDTARQMAFFYIEHPAEFDKFVMQFFLDKNQSAIAKERKMTRANVSKRIITERGDKLKREIAKLKKQNSAFATMTATELKVYQLCGEDGVLSISNIAKQGGISRQTVYNTLHNLSEKYGIRFTLNRNRRKKS